MKFHWPALCFLLLSPLAVASPLDGRALFETNCAACHGAAGEGTAIAPKLAGDSSHWSAALFRRAVLTGVDDKGKALKAPMPHWQSSSFTDDDGKPPTKQEIDAIQHFLRKIK